tara:strand:- start:264 stop:377 length:114 start_codon:yes stop_codon:yes gene_type:complete
MEINVSEYLLPKKGEKMNDFFEIFKLFLALIIFIASI